MACQCSELCDRSPLSIRPEPAILKPVFYDDLGPFFSFSGRKSC